MGATRHSIFVVLNCHVWALGVIVKAAPVAGWARKQRGTEKRIHHLVSSVEFRALSFEC